MELGLSAAALFVLALLLAGLMFKSAHENTLNVHELKMESFPLSFGTVRIFFISDIHRRTISKALLAKMDKKADMVIIGGDLTEKGVPLERTRENIARLCEIGPVYFVWGNNDYEGNYHELDALLLEMNVKILDNTAASFQSLSGEKLTLLGVDDFTLNKDRLDYALMDAGDGGFRILASHNPGIMEKVKPEDNISFVMCGHTHGGQIRIFGYGPYKKGGIEKVGETVVLISNGYGTTAIPLRLGAPPEAHLILLSHGAGEK